MNKKLSKDWRLKKISDFATQKRGLTYNSSDIVKKSFVFPLYINMKSFKKDGGYNEKGEKFFKSTYKNEQFVKKNDLLIANTDITPTCDILGTAIYISQNKLNKGILYSHHVTALSLDKTVDSKFIYYLFNSDSTRMEMHKNGRGTTVKMLDIKEVLKYQVLLPSFSEQKKIASILTSVDNVIEKTQSQINKLQDLKTSVINELLTKGIGHTEFQNSELGRIPKSWDLVKIQDSKIKIIDGDRGNEYPKKNDFSSQSYCLFLSAKNVTKKGFRFDECEFISKEKDESLRKGRLAKGDLIITSRGTVGNIAIFDETVPYEIIRINSGMAIIRNVNNCLSSTFLYQFLISEIATKQLEHYKFGSAQPQITIQTIKSIKLLIPPLEEQNLIVKNISSIDIKSDNLNNKFQKLVFLKKSLMQDLLTGKVRVSVN